MSYALSDDAKKVMNEIYREFVRSMNLARPGISEEEAMASLRKVQANGDIQIEVDPKCQQMRIVPVLK